MSPRCRQRFSWHSSVETSQRFFVMNSPDSRYTLAFETRSDDLIIYITQLSERLVWVSYRLAEGVSQCSVRYNMWMSSECFFDLKAMGQQQRLRHGDS